MCLGQGTHDLGMVDDEGGIDAMHFNELSNKLVKKTRSRTWCLAFNIMLTTELIQEAFHLGCVHLRGRRELDTQAASRPAIMGIRRKGGVKSMTIG